jgi:hypothetical protein
MLSLPSLRSLCSPKKARRVWPGSIPTAPAALLGAALLALHATPARAQQLHVVPAALSDLEGPSSFGVPGVSHSALRIQIVIGASELTPVAGRSLTGLWLRRDTSWEDALPTARGALTVRIGAAAHGPDVAQPSFAANLPTSTLVYDGELRAPAAGAVTEGNTSWSADQTVRIPFQTPFVYGGGDLAIEFTRTGTAATFWPSDATEDTAAGNVVSVGTTCGPLASMQQTAHAGPRGLVLGRTASFLVVGTPSSPAWLMVGAALRAVPIDLTAFGAPGCVLHAQPWVTLPTFLSNANDGFAGNGLANVDVHLPTDPNLGGAILGTQFLEFGAQGLITSNALLCQLATTGPMLPMAAVVSRDGETPDVVSLAIPVLGLTWQ